MADVDKIMAELKRMNTRLVYLEAQNKSLGNLIVDAPLKVWQFPVWRTAKGKRTPIKVIDEFAAMNTRLASVEAHVRRK